VVKLSLQVPIVVVYLAFAACVFGSDDSDTKGEEWQKAAQHREWAASVQQGQAQDLLDLAQELRKREYLYDADRRGHLRQAGDLENRAGDLHAGASGNLEKAALDWDKAAGEYKRLHEKERHNNALIMAEHARKNVLIAYRRAAESYELAAEAYGENGADDPDKEVMARIKAATWREKLAVRK
jgi:hypothetical protein